MDLRMGMDAEEAEIVRDHFKVDPFKVFEILNKIVSLIKIQMMRDRYTSPDCSYETLKRMILLKKEDDRSMEVYLNDLLKLLMKPDAEVCEIKMLPKL